MTRVDDYMKKETSMVWSVAQADRPGLVHGLKLIDPKGMIIIKVLFWSRGIDPENENT